MKKSCGGRATIQSTTSRSIIDIEIQTRHAAHIDQVRIIPRKEFYVIEVVYEQAVKQTAVNPALYAGIDLGLNNLVALASNKPGFHPVVINGRPVKSTNQFYNKRKAELQHKLGHTGSTARMERITTKRNNQNFVQIPHARFIAMLTYKAELVGIIVLLTEESNTSKASFLDRDPLPVRKLIDDTKHTFSGKRVERGLYRASGNRFINADLNGAYNIIRKVAPDAFGRRAVEDGRATPYVVHPARITLAKPRTRAVNRTPGFSEL